MIVRYATQKHPLPMSRRFQFSLARLMLATAPLAVASLFMGAAMRQSAMRQSGGTLLAIAAISVCVAWAAAIVLQRLAIAWIVPVALLFLLPILAFYFPSLLW